MKKYTGIAILIFILMGSSLKDALIYVGFEMNRGIIAEKWCENKDRPEMHCDGQCVFMKAIRASEEQEKEPFSVENLKGGFSCYVVTKYENVDFAKRLRFMQNLHDTYLLIRYKADLPPLLKPPIGKL